MLDTQSPLIAEFLKDHQRFSRLLLEISKLLEADEIDEARQRSIELNEIAGPHIAYEEAELYPRLDRLGERSVTESDLVNEHRLVLNAVRQLVSGSKLDQQAMDSIKSAFHAALNHAEHCGSLISLMAQLSDSEKSQSLTKLLELRKQGRKWTEL